MSIDRIEGAQHQARIQATKSKPQNAALQENKTEGTASIPGDTVSLGGSMSTRPATYSRAEIRTEQPPANPARAAKLESVRQKLETGFYDSSTVSERVADRLLAKWKIGPSSDGSEQA